MWAFRAPLTSLHKLAPSIIIGRYYDKIVSLEFCQQNTKILEFFRQNCKLRILSDKIVSLEFCWTEL